MCLFGYPLAHENDAERAARAALLIQRALAELNRKNAGTAKPELVARVGLESDGGAGVGGAADGFVALAASLWAAGLLLSALRVLGQTQFFEPISNALHRQYPADLF